MGIIDSIKGKADQLDKTYNPLRKAADVIAAQTEKIPPTPPPPATVAAPSAEDRAPVSTWGGQPTRSVGEDVTKQKLP